MHKCIESQEERFLSRSLSEKSSRISSGEPLLHMHAAIDSDFRMLCHHDRLIGKVRNIPKGSSNSQTPDTERLPKITLSHKPLED